MDRPHPLKRRCETVVSDWAQAEQDARRRQKACEELERAHPTAKESG
jgi:hypothetical protein